MGIFDLIRNFFKGKKEEESYPFEFFAVEVNPIAKSKGIDDEHNKIIKIYKGGELIEEKNYTKELHEELKKEMPGYEEAFDDEEFEYFPFDELGIVKYKHG